MFIKKIEEKIHEKYQLKSEKFSIKLNNEKQLYEALSELLNSLEKPEGKVKIGTKLIFEDKYIHIEFKDELKEEDILKRIEFISQSDKNLNVLNFSIIITYIRIK
jgi:hypothetical protein